MDIGKQLKKARLEAGLSQRQLCGNLITRNMLSLIENGTARPSMDTLICLAERLGKPVSYFMEEDAAISPNTVRMRDARNAFAAGQYNNVLEILTAYQLPDETFDWEKSFLETLCLMSLAAEALSEGRFPYAERLLSKARQASEKTPYFRKENEQALLSLQSRIHPELAGGLSLDALLLQKAEAETDPTHAAALLDAMEDHNASRWCLLRGKAAVGMGTFSAAKTWLKQAESDYPQQALPLLEDCCRELGDFQGAYEYACRRRKNKA